jgi:hypothetical protein
LRKIKGEREVFLGEGLPSEGERGEGYFSGREKEEGRARARGDFRIRAFQ